MCFSPFTQKDKDCKHKNAIATWHSEQGQVFQRHTKVTNSKIYCKQITWYLCSKILWVFTSLALVSSLQKETIKHCYYRLRARRRTKNYRLLRVLIMDTLKGFIRIILFNMIGYCSVRRPKAGVLGRIDLGPAVYSSVILYSP